MNLSEKITKRKQMADELKRLDAQIEEEASSRGPLTEKDEQAMVGFQQIADDAYVALSRRAPPPMPQERPRQYQRRLLDELKPYDREWRDQDIFAMPDAVLMKVVGPSIIASAIHAGKHGLDLKRGEIREIVRRGDGGHKVSDFVGGKGAHFIHQFGSPGFIGILPTRQEAQEMSRQGLRAPARRSA